MSTSKPPADEYGGLDKWLRAATGKHDHSELPAAGTSSQEAEEYTGGYGGLGYSYGAMGRVRKGQQLSPPSVLPPRSARYRCRWRQ